jgi:hypothetical protein
MVFATNRNGQKDRNRVVVDNNGIEKSILDLTKGKLYKVQLSFVRLLLTVSASKLLRISSTGF